MRHSSSMNAMRECVPQNVLTGFPTCKDCTPKAEASEFGVSESHYCDGQSCFKMRQDYEIRLLQVKGLRLNPITTWIPIPFLEETIISHDFDRKLSISPSVFGSAIAVPYWHIPGLRSLNSQLAASFRSRHNLSKDLTLILHGERSDDFLETVFTRSCDRRFFDICASLWPVVLIAPGYSVYTDGCQCRHWQPYNLKRSAKFLYDATSYGLPCVPYIASNHERDTERICDWLNGSDSAVNHVAINWQTRGSAVLKDNIRLAQAIENACNRPLHWLIFGVAHQESINQIAQNLNGPLLFVTSKPLQRGFARRDIYNNPVSLGTRQEIIDKNVLDQRKLVASCILAHRE